MAKNINDTYSVNKKTADGIEDNLTITGLSDSPCPISVKITADPELNKNVKNGRTVLTVELETSIFLTWYDNFNIRRGQVLDQSLLNSGFESTSYDFSKKIGLIKDSKQHKQEWDVVLPDSTIFSYNYYSFGMPYENWEDADADPITDSVTGNNTMLNLSDAKFNEYIHLWNQTNLLYAKSNGSFETDISKATQINVSKIQTGLPSISLTVPAFQYKYNPITKPLVVKETISVDAIKYVLDKVGIGEISYDKTSNKWSCENSVLTSSDESVLHNAEFGCMPHYAPYLCTVGSDITKQSALYSYSTLGDVFLPDTTPGHTYTNLLYFTPTVVDYDKNKLTQCSNFDGLTKEQNYKFENTSNIANIFNENVAPPHLTYMDGNNNKDMRPGYYRDMFEYLGFSLYNYENARPYIPMYVTPGHLMSDLGFTGSNIINRISPGTQIQYSIDKMYEFKTVYDDGFAAKLYVNYENLDSNHVTYITKDINDFLNDCVDNASTKSEYYKNEAGNLFKAYDHDCSIAYFPQFRVPTKSWNFFDQPYCWLSAPVSLEKQKDGKTYVDNSGDNKLKIVGSEGTEEFNWLLNPNASNVKSKNFIDYMNISLSTESSDKTGEAHTFNITPDGDSIEIIDIDFGNITIDGKETKGYHILQNAYVPQIHKNVLSKVWEDVMFSDGLYTAQTDSSSWIPCIGGNYRFSKYKYFSPKTQGSISQNHKELLGRNFIKFENANSGYDVSHPNYHDEYMMTSPFDSADAVKRALRNIATNTGYDSRENVVNSTIKGRYNAMKPFLSPSYKLINDNASSMFKNLRSLKSVLTDAVHSSDYPLITCTNKGELRLNRCISLKGLYNIHNIANPTSEQVNLFTRMKSLFFACNEYSIDPVCNVANINGKFCISNPWSGEYTAIEPYKRKLCSDNNDDSRETSITYTNERKIKTTYYSDFNLGESSFPNGNNPIEAYQNIYYVPIKLKFNVTVVGAPTKRATKSDSGDITFHNTYNINIVSKLEKADDKIAELSDDIPMLDSINEFYYNDKNFDTTFNTMFESYKEQDKLDELSKMFKVNVLVDDSTGEYAESNELFIEVLSSKELALKGPKLALQKAISNLRLSKMQVPLNPIIKVDFVPSVLSTVGTTFGSFAKAEVIL